MEGSKGFACSEAAAPEAPVTETRNPAMGSKTRTTMMILQFWEIIIFSNFEHFS